MMLQHRTHHKAIAKGAVTRDTTASFAPAMGWLLRPCTTCGPSLLPPQQHPSRSGRLARVPNCAQL
eukprot:499219-Pelagomonas_calceolata.AAC.2